MELINFLIRMMDIIAYRCASEIVSGHAATATIHASRKKGGERRYVRDNGAGLTWLM